MKDSEIQARWTPAITLEINKQIQSVVKKRSEFPQSPFGKTPLGMQDYRGFILREMVANLEFEKIDFSQMRTEWAGTFRECIIRESFFLKALMPGGFLGRHFLNCTFDQANLSNGSINKATFEQCTFLKANLSKIGGSEAHFLNCSFDESNLKHAQIIFSEFSGCTFKKTKFHNGSLTGSRFKNIKIDDVEWGNTIMEKTFFCSTH